MNMTAYETRRPRVRIPTWWLRERDNEEACCKAGSGRTNIVRPRVDYSKKNGPGLHPGRFRLYVVGSSAYQRPPPPPRRSAPRLKPPPPRRSPPPRGPPPVRS